MPEFAAPINPSMQVSKSVLENTFEGMNIDPSNVKAFEKAMSQSTPDTVSDLQALQDQLNSIQSQTTSGIQNIKSADASQLDQMRAHLLDQVNGLPDPKLPGPADQHIGSDALQTIKKQFDSYNKIRSDLVQTLQDPKAALQPDVMIQIQMQVGELQTAATLFAQLSKKTGDAVSTLFRNQ